MGCCYRLERVRKPLLYPSELQAHDCCRQMIAVRFCHYKGPPPEGNYRQNGPTVRIGAAADHWQASFFTSWMLTVVGSGQSAVEIAFRFLRCLPQNVVRDDAIAVKQAPLSCSWRKAVTCLLQGSSIPRLGWT